MDLLGRYYELQHMQVFFFLYSSNTLFSIRITPRRLDDQMTEPSDFFMLRYANAMYNLYQMSTLRLIKFFFFNSGTVDLELS